MLLIVLVLHLLLLMAQSALVLMELSQTMVPVFNNVEIFHIAKIVQHKIHAINVFRDIF